MLLYFLFNFFLYGLIGWVIEEFYCLVMTGHFQEDGFLYGPFKPMYAIAMSLLILIQETLNLPTVLLIVLCAIIPTTVEYLSGLLTRHVFHVDYWNYYDLKYNIQGLICLQFSCYWTILTYIGIRFVQPMIKYNVYLPFVLIWRIIIPFLVLAFLIDEGLTIRKHVIMNQTKK